MENMPTLQNSHHCRINIATTDLALPTLPFFLHFLLPSFFIFFLQHLPNKHLIHLLVYFFLSLFLPLFDHERFIGDHARHVFIEDIG